MGRAKKWDGRKAIFIVMRMRRRCTDGPPRTCRGLGGRDAMQDIALRRGAQARDREGSCGVWERAEALDEGKDRVSTCSSGGGGIVCIRVCRGGVGPHLGRGEGGGRRDS